MIASMAYSIFASIPKSHWTIGKQGTPNHFRHRHFWKNKKHILMKHGEDLSLNKQIRKLYFYVFFFHGPFPLS